MKTLTIIGGVFLVGLICIQTIWFTKAYNANVIQFEHSVSVALFTVADTMSEHAVVEKRSSNYFYVKMNCPASSQVIDTLIRKEFSMRNLNLDYALGVYNVEDDSLIHGNYVSASSPTIFHNYDEKKLDLCNKDFAVLFPNKESYMLGKMDLWMYTSFFLILISSVFVHFISTKRGQNKVRNQAIKLGNSSLDFHNRQLVVYDLTHQLTYKEFKIIKLFFENPNQIIERNVFLEQVWEKDGFFVERSMDVFISKIRKYLATDQKLKIENLRSIGYRLLVAR
ncbi:MAG: winged helix-turn-helix domain-containing protein [Bacteroidota bacterium]